MTNDPSLLLKKIRRLTQALLISGALNMGVLGLLSYWIVRERPPTPYCELRPASDSQQQLPLADHRGCNEVVAQLYKMPFHSLVNRLTRNQLVENGYAERDLALSCLIAFHYFDIQRALPPDNQPQQKRLLVWKHAVTGEPVSLPVYPSLSDKQFDALIRFARTERWPLTAQGLFLMLQRQGKETHLNPDLVETFMLTPEFWTVELLFSRSEQPISKQKILTILIEGKWDLLKQFADQQRQLHDLSDARRQKFLLDYIKEGAKSAAEWMIKSDWDFAVKKLDDSQAMAILQLLDKTPESERFAKEMLISPRSTSVWRQASLRLYEFAGEQAPKEWSYEAALARFSPEKLTEVKPAPSPPAPLAAGPSARALSPMRPLPINEKAPMSLPKTLAAKDTPSSDPLANKPRAAKKAASPSSQPAPSVRTYTVQKGDSLWKIAQKFKVDVNVLKEGNQLQSDAIKPGMVLKIP